MLAAAAQRAKIAFDLIIFDEAHRTAGASTNPFATLLPDEALEARYRLFMTATERKIDGAVDVYSMDEHEDIYGKRFFTMTYKEAIEAGIISDYKILTVVVSDEEITSYIDENRLLDLHRDLHEAEARAIATGIALKKMVSSTASRTRCRFIPASKRPIISASNKTCSTACHRQRKTFTSPARRRQDSANNCWISSRYRHARL